MLASSSGSVFNNPWISGFFFEVKLPQKIINDVSLTFAEKVVSIKADGTQKVHRAGEIAVLPADMAMALDSTRPLGVKVFREVGVERVWDRKKSTWSLSSLQS